MKTDWPEKGTDEDWDEYFLRLDKHCESEQQLRRWEILWVSVVFAILSLLGIVMGILTGFWS